MLPQNYSTKVQFNQAIHGRYKGKTETVRTDKNGVILDKMIRRRLADNDGSVVLLKQEKVKDLKKKTVKKGDD